MANFKSVPITLITGYLGSGKTTLINHILRNAKGNKMAVIVNDIGEVNIDADLIENNGVVSGKDENLVALSNGCICCTLKQDLIQQLADLVKQQKYDHILIEASGICEPVPIAQTITYMEQEFEKQHLPKFYWLDAIISVTDALRLRDEFGCGETLKEATRGEENLENLVIQQIEFCDIVLLNKASLISKEELRRVKIAIKALQPEAEIIESDFCDVDIDRLIDTDLFDFDKASGSAAWIREFEDWDSDVEHHDEDDEEDEEEEHHHHHDHDDDDDDEHEHEEHEHHHHHHHHHHHGIENEEEGTALEYDINTYCALTKTAASQSYKIDTNLDGKFNDEDCLASKYNFFVLTSALSFSCATWFPHLAKENGCATIVGENTSGGACNSYITATPDGKIFRISGIAPRASFKDNPGAHPDNGVIVDYPMERDYFYNDDYLNTFANSITRQTKS